MTQIKIIGYIGISELFIYFLAPILFFRDWRLLVKHGFKPIMIFAALWMINGLVSDWYRQNSFENTIKGFAATYSVLSSIIVIHALLWDDIWRVRWAALGFAVSVVLSTYVIQSGVHVEVALDKGIAVTEAALDYKLTIVSLVTSFAVIPIVFTYMRLPLLSAFIAAVVGGFSLLQGGRSAFLAKMLTVCLILLVRNSRVRMARIQRSFYLLGFSLMIVAALAAVTYKYVVRQGLMGEDELKKYEVQSQTKMGILSGRSTMVGSALALIDSPFLGFGSWAVDKYGYRERAADLIGDDSFRENLYRDPYMPTHSHLFGAWINNGIFGGVFWVYALVLIYRTVKYNMGVEPRLFGYLAVMIPPMMWNIIFSPFSARLIVTTSLTVFLILDYNRRHGALYPRGGPPNMRY